MDGIFDRKGGGPATGVRRLVSLSDSSLHDAIVNASSNPFLCPEDRCGLGSSCGAGKGDGVRVSRLMGGCCGFINCLC